MQRRDKKIDPSSCARRHSGTNEYEVRAMLREVGFESLDTLVEAAVPKNIRLDRELNLPESKSEMEALDELRAISRKNKIARSFIGCGYSDCITPPVIQRNVFENPGWYTAYTPYQAEIAQGRLEALVNFQTMITDLTGMEIANASLLDEATAAAEAMAMAHALSKAKSDVIAVAADLHPQTRAVLKTRAWPLGIGRPHAAYTATKDTYKRAMPGRLVGVSVDAAGAPAMRLALQTREQHIRREKATSNICTAQVLLAGMAGMYAVWHGPEGLKEIARRVHRRARTLAAVLGDAVLHADFSDTVLVHV